MIWCENYWAGCFRVFEFLLRLLYLWSCLGLYTLDIQLSPSFLCSYPTPHPHLFWTIEVLLTLRWSRSSATWDWCWLAHSQIRAPVVRHSLPSDPLLQPWWQFCYHWLLVPHCDSGGVDDAGVNLKKRTKQKTKNWGPAATVTVRLTLSLLFHGLFATAALNASLSGKAAGWPQKKDPHINYHLHFTMQNTTISRS